MYALTGAAPARFSGDRKHTLLSTTTQVLVSAHDTACRVAGLVVACVVQSSPASAVPSRVPPAPTVSHWLALGQATPVSAWLLPLLWLLQLMLPAPVSTMVPTTSR